jgi:regulatory protein
LGLTLSLTPTQLRSRALAALARREHSRLELQRKLLACLQTAADRNQEALPDDAQTRVDALLDALVGQDLLSEARYIDSRLRTRAPRLGARRLTAELAQQGLKPEGETWEAIRSSEADRAGTLLARRFGLEPPADLKEKARRVRFLVSRGFAPALALRLVERNEP